MSGPVEPTPQNGKETDPWAYPRIYVASLSDYNAGILHGEWVNADVGVEVVHEVIAEMLADSPTTARYGDIAEEWAIHDYSGFGSVHLGEYESLERVCAIAQGIVAHGDAYAAWVANDESGDLSAETFEDSYLGEWGSETEWGESLLDDFGIDLDDIPGVPEGLRPYVQVDVEGWVRDMRLNGEVSFVESRAGVYVFRP
jgi:antirestriction protein